MNVFTGIYAKLSYKKKSSMPCLNENLTRSGVFGRALYKRGGGLMASIHTIQQILRGLEPAGAQAVGNMTVIPLVSDIVDDSIIPPDALEFETSNYGTVVAFNVGTRNENGLTVSPLGNLVMTDKRAQNHVVPDMRLIKKDRRVVMDNAACVQQTQGGLVQRGKYKLMLLPVALREEALTSRKEHSYDKLWGAIREFNRTFGLSGTGHLEHFLDRFTKELDEFVAQFEVVPRQVGAVIMINHTVVGLERFPNFRYFKVMWEPLIRECYGSMSIQAARAGGAVIPKNRVLLDEKGVFDLAGIKAALIKAKSLEKAETRRIVNGFIKTKFKVRREEKADGFVLETMANPQLKGQLVRKRQIPLMFSFVKTRQWLSDPNQERMAAARAFRM